MVINILSNRSEWTFYFLSSVQFNFTISEINITETLEDLGLTTEKTDDATLLNKLGASVGVNSCSYVKIPKGGD